MAVVVVAGPEGQCPMKAAGTHARRSELLSVMSVCPFLVVTGDLRGRPAKPHFKDENMGVQRRLCLDWGLCSLWTEGLKAARLTWGFGRGCGGGGLAAKSCLTLATPWTVACQAPLSMEFSR